MAIYEPGAGLDPFRGLDLGTVFQRGKYAPVIKSGSKTQGQRLAPFQDQKAAWYRALQLWRDLSPADKSNWDAARPDFPTTDRYGNTVLSSARDLFLRTIARLPITDQKPLNTPRSPYAGSPVSDPSIYVYGSSLFFKVPDVPVGEQFGYSLFMSIQRPLSTNFAKPSFRRVLFDTDYPAGADIDITSEYTALFGSLVPGNRIFFCAEIVNTDTPEVLSSVCDSFLSPGSGPYPDPVSPVCWLDFSDPSNYVLDAFGVNRAYDQSGNGFDFTQSTNSAKPSISTSFFNGNSALLLNGTSQFMQHLTNMGITSFPYTAYVVVQSDGPPQNGWVLSMVDASSSIISYPVTLRAGFTTGNPISVIYAARIGLSVIVSQPVVNGAQDPYVIVGGSNSNTDHFVYQNGVLPGAFSSASKGFSVNVDAFLLGRLRLVGSALYTKSAVGEVLIYNSQHDQETRAAIINYLLYKWIS